MNKSRIFGGFSLVEMMLLLLIVSLMIASGVAVISKRHVKVPHLAVHGAYMCYYKNGTLHEERYVGSGLTKKIFDDDVTECVFTPPERTSYLHIQATGGGGGGGDSGYKGGNVTRNESKVEKISPFGITEGLLELKGILLESLQAYGGKISAYADASGKKGDAGAGGNLWYIKQECGSGSCLVQRDWEYKGHKDRECKYVTKNVAYRYNSYQYYYDCEKTRTGGGWSAEDCDVSKDEEYDVVEDSYDYDECTGDYNVESCDGESVDACDAGCTKKETATCIDLERTGDCSSCPYKTVDGKKICTGGTYNTGVCLKGSKYIKNSSGVKQCAIGRKYKGTYKNCKYTDHKCFDSDHICEVRTAVPEDSEDCTTYSQELTVYAKDTYAKDTDAFANYLQKKTDPPSEYLNDTDRTRAERKLVRDQGEEITICNYGNPTKFTGVQDGIFGSFTSNDGVGVACTTEAIAEAFGDDIFPVSTTLNPVSAKVNSINYDVSSKEVYGGVGILFDRSEEFDTPYGTYCVNTVGGSCGSQPPKENAPSYENPVTGEVFDLKESIPVGCNLTSSSGSDVSNDYTTHDENECSGTGNFDTLGYGRIQCSNCSRSVSIRTRSYCAEPSTTQKGSYCMYEYDDYGSHNGGGTETDPEFGNGDGSSYTKGGCMYVAAMAEGGTAGLGTKCTVGPVDAGLALTYKGFSSVLPGIRGSDVNCTTNSKSVKVFYKESEWNAQPSCFAENGTDSVGYAEVNLNGESCIANQQAPTAGKGARKEFVGSTGTVVPGGSVVDGNGKNGTTTGTVKAGTSVGEQHVGYRVDGKENHKYSYQYTWDTNYMQYGEGGKAGEYQVRIVRAIKDKSYRITVGRGGAAGANGTGADGTDGGDTVIEGLLTAEGGAGGRGGLTTPVEQMPYWMGSAGAGFDYTKGQAGGAGGKHTDLNIKTNVMNLILPVDNFVLQKWVMASGEGGNGGGSRNDCWASEWEKYLEGHRLDESVTEDQFDCNRATDWSATPAAENGIDGLVLIRW